MKPETLHFFDKVYKVVKQIPYGKVTSYGAIANYLGAAKSARIVGYAMNASHYMNDVPAHRVVNRNGLLTGKFHFEGTNVMQQMLEEEGVVVKNNQVVPLKDYYWDPNEALAPFEHS
ncbi:MGMT family protein [Formosa haliotis]|uniref:MGMT family protein n=1 Tax=Formosa haliotis TaxID=1555194 RepID=UPI000825242A|nr:MGMT family protein [Formosa haliotis]